MLEYTFHCHVCSRMFMRDWPFSGPLPRHLDALLGLPCPGSGQAVLGCLRLPDGSFLPVITG